MFVWKTKLIYQGEITNYGGNSNQLSFFSCVRAVTRQAGATRTSTALSKHKVFSFLDKEFFVGWQTINFISTLSPIWGMPCRLLKWQTYIYPNMTSGNSCPEGPGGEVFTRFVQVDLYPKQSLIHLKWLWNGVSGRRYVTCGLCSWTPNSWHFLSFYIDCYVSKVCKGFSQP